MSEKSNIAWTDDTWNPWRGCAKVSPGCTNCYAEELVTRRMGGEWGKGKPRVQAKSTLHDPFRWNKKPWVCDDCGNSCADNVPGEVCRSFHRRRVFSLSLGDFLDPEVPIEWLAQMLDTIRLCPGLDFLLLTKRIQNFLPLLQSVWRLKVGNLPLAQWCADWEMRKSTPSNVWLGVSVEDQQRADERIPLLLQTPAAVRFLSIEPLLERVSLQNIPVCDFPSRTQVLNGSGIDWVIVGGESGSKRRDCGVEAIEDMARQCQAAGVSCFVKQDSARRPGQRGRLSDELWAMKEFPR